MCILYGYKKSNYFRTFSANSKKRCYLIIGALIFCEKIVMSIDKYAMTLTVRFGMFVRNNYTCGKNTYANIDKMINLYGYHKRDLSRQLTVNLILKIQIYFFRRI